jgi:hypothetical protein
LYQDTTYRRKKLDVKVYWGKSHCGKTHTAKMIDGNDDPNYYYMLNPPKSDGVLWWMGYKPETHRLLIIDEMSGSFMPFTYFKRLCDGNIPFVDVKGSSLPFKFEKIIFTSNYHPCLWYKLSDENDIAAFNNRIPFIDYFD